MLVTANHDAAATRRQAGDFVFGAWESSFGGVPEWLKGTGCKPVGYAYAVSNPALSTIIT